MSEQSPNIITKSELNPAIVAKLLLNEDGVGFSDEQFAEMFVYFEKMRDLRTTADDVVKTALTSEDMLQFDIDAFTNELNTMLHEIIDVDSECDEGAWWKQNYEVCFRPIPVDLGLMCKYNGKELLVKLNDSEEYQFVKVDYSRGLLSFIKKDDPFTTLIPIDKVVGYLSLADLSRIPIG